MRKESTHKDRKRLFNFFIRKLARKSVLRKEQKFLRSCTVLGKMIEEEIVDFVRAQNAFGLLRNLSVIIGRQKFRRHRRIENVVQDLLQFHRRFSIGTKLQRIVRIPVYDMAHKRLGNIAVDRIHRHVIGIVRAPAKRNLGKVARSNHNSAFAIRNIHQNLRAFARLDILVSHVELLRVMADILEMLEARILDAYSPQFNAQKFRKQNSIVLRALCRSKSRHRERQDFQRRAFQQLERFCDNEQRKRRIKTARKSNHSTLGARSFQTFRKTCTLDIENLSARLIARF